MLTSPVIRCLHQQVPDAQIHFATKKKFASLVSEDPRISKVHELDGNFSEFIQPLKAEKFDLIIDLHNNLRTMRIKMLLGVPSKSFHKLNFKKWLFVHQGWNTMPKEHIVERYLKTCEHLGVVYDQQGLDFYFKADTELPTGLQKELPAKFAVYAIGGTYATKKMPSHKIEELLGKTTMPVVLIGDDKDKLVAEQFTQLPNAINACGMLTIAQSALLIQHSAFVVAHDTGMMHIAAALQKKVISIWGNTVPEFGMWPLFPSALQQNFDIRAEVDGLGCRPCSKLGFNQCPKRHFYCMELQNTDEIAEKLV